MNHHKNGEELVREHPILCGLIRSLKRSGKLREPILEFLKRQAFFAYPGTLWLKLSVDSEDLATRHATDLTGLGLAITQSVLETPAIRTIVFDFEGVTILDPAELGKLVNAAGSDRGRLIRTFWVCTPELRSLLTPHITVRRTAFFTSRRDALIALREVPESRILRVSFPEVLDLFSLDAALRAQATKKDMASCDAIAFDMSAVKTISFEANSMLSPIVHSIAHEYGVLSRVSSFSAKVEQTLIKHGSLFPMRSYFIQTPQNLLQEPTISENAEVLPLTSFVSDDRIQALCDAHIREMLQGAMPWLSNVSGVTVGSSSREFKSSLTVFRNLIHIIRELLENVSMHSHGVGYVMMELDPGAGMGLNVYIGDTGIGLTRGISRGYRMAIRSDAMAVKIVFHLVDHMAKRRNLPGHLAFGGRGLDRVRTTLQTLAGKLTIRTGNALASYQPGKSSEPFGVQTGLFHVEGTHIHISIPTRSRKAQ